MTEVLVLANEFTLDPHMVTVRQETQRCASELRKQDDSKLNKHRWSIGRHRHPLVVYKKLPRTSQLALASPTNLITASNSLCFSVVADQVVQLVILLNNIC